MEFEAHSHPADAAAEIASWAASAPVGGGSSAVGDFGTGLLRCVGTKQARRARGKARSQG